MNKIQTQLSGFIMALKSSLKELREKISCSEVLNDKICLSESSSEPACPVGRLFCRNGTKRNFSNSFTEHASFGTFLEFIPIKSGLRKVRGNFTTMINVIPSDKYLVIEAWNKHCKIRVAEKNTQVIYRLIKTNFRLYLKTIKTLLNKNFKSYDLILLFESIIIMETQRPQINSSKKICVTKREQKKLFDDPDSSGEEFFFCSGVKKIFRNLFAALTFCFFCVKTKEKSIV